MIRLDRDGNLDTSFGTDGRVLTDFAGRADNINGLVLQNDGEIVAVGSTVGANSTDFALARFLPDGSLDQSFGQGGKVVHSITDDTDVAYAALVTVDGFIVVGGSANRGTTASGVDFALARFASNGQLDRNFGDPARAIAIDTAGKLVVAGWAYEGWAYEGNSSAGNFVTMRYLTDGTLDPSFGPGGVVITQVAAGTKPDESRAIAIQIDDRVPTHRFVVGGWANNANADFAVTRYWR